MLRVCYTCGRGIDIYHPAYELAYKDGWANFFNGTSNRCPKCRKIDKYYWVKRDIDEATNNENPDYLNAHGDRVGRAYRGRSRVG